MQTLNRTIHALEQLGKYMLSKPDELKDIMRIAEQHNGWFDLRSQEHAIQSIATEFLNKEKLSSFVKKYKIGETSNAKKIALILAGNIPLVGFHDVLCTLLCGHQAMIKLSSKDDRLTKAIFMKLIQIDSSFRERIQFTNEQLRDFDAVIATGSNNSARYFERYFGKYLNIIRKNRNSVAILSGKETDDQLLALGKDIFAFYGLGCRNVSKIFVPKDYDFNHFLEIMNEYKEVLNNQKYKNNYDYNLTLLLLNQIPYLSNDCLLVTKNESLHSRIATLHYQEYERLDEVNTWIQENKDSIQAVIGSEHIPYGQAQQPTLTDFADHIDTMEFLLQEELIK